MDEASVAIQIADATKDDNPLVYVNDGFEQITGYEPEEVLGQNPRFLQGDDTDPESRQRLREAISREEPVSLDIQNYRKDGTPYWSQLSITPVTDKHGTVENYIGIQQDITERREREQKLLAERERFRLLIESVDEYAFLAINEDGQIQTWNESAKQLFGYTDESALGMDVATLHPPADRKSKIPERLLQQAKVAGKSSHEGWRVTADGDQFYADTRYVRLENDEGTSHGYAQIVRDMTERRQQRRRTERFVEESEDVIAIVGTDGTFSYVSGSAQAVLAYDPNEIVGENIFDYVHETEREQLMQTFFATVERTDADQQAECRFKSGNDDWLNIELQCRNMLDDDAIDGMLLYLRDVTDSKQRTRRFESIFNQTFQFAGLLEPDGTVIEVNDTEIIPASDQSDRIVGDRFHETPFWTHSETVQNKVQDAITQARKGETVRFKTEMQGASGLATVDLSIKPVITDEGDISVLVAEGRDITDQQHRRQHIDVIHRVMRHNMRNDLSKLRGWAQQMSEEPEPSTRAEHLATLERIFDKWESMTDRVKQIRQASRQSNKVAGVNPESLIEDAVAPITEQYPAATISTDISVDASTQVPAILLDAVRELVENAAKADTDATINLEVTSAENEWVELCVRDDGPGLPEIEAHALETGNETDLDHGQGLGLWMVRMITTQIGGDISVELNERGTEINLHIPTK
ncbi:PAS domain S-box protein [Halorubrum ezzemoulense]|uniref:PAS domain S-box protein n=1 Tax=Halorubrum ezzemoulense TaxID=337243 RepID=UPI00232B43D3|nr:PAS domain S-box protein [Halorubrum ezzemoulense]MDB9254202.1 PAS domain S-box protein [Halorubrum ezzemoulense]MDB9257553.1 PAS domain S-box protein [Halorubrum ezzemoulense]MDB9278270.1 PAS domain S-box protein [Halorubrum ezzemoulense]